MRIRATRAIKHNGLRYWTGDVFDADGKWGEYLIRHGAAESATEAPGDLARDDDAADPGSFDAKETPSKPRQSSRKRK